MLLSGVYEIMYCIFMVVFFFLFCMCFVVRVWGFFERSEEVSSLQLCTQTSMRIYNCDVLWQKIHVNS